MNYDERFTALANRDLRNYWGFLQARNKKTEDAKFVLFSNVDPFSPVDCIQRKYDESGDFSEANIELKGRNIDITTYPDCLVDLSKVQSLMKIADQSGNPSFVVALYYQSGKLAIWKIEPDAEYQVSEKTTLKYSAAPEQGKQAKAVVSLPLSDASIHSFTPIA